MTASMLTDPAQNSSSATRSEGSRRRVVVYSGADAKANQNSLFYLHLFWSIIEQGHRMDFEMVPLMDTRPLQNRFGPPKEFAQIEKAGAVDGVVAIMAYDSMLEWIREMGLPFTYMHGKHSDIAFNTKGMAELSIRRLAKLGARSLGLMVPPGMANAEVLEMLDETADQLGVTINYEWIIVSRASMETKGYQQFESLWELKSRPDGLLIYPDVMARGVVSAIVERRVRVPEELKLVLHRNAESPYVVPFPCDWVEMRVDPIAEVLLSSLEARWRGEVPPRKIIEFRLVHGESERSS